MLKPIYWFSGDESELVRQHRDDLLKRAKAEGFEQHLRFVVESGFAWSFVESQAYNQDLFAEKKLIEIQCQEAKIDASFQAGVQAYCENPPMSTVLLITSAKLTGLQEKAAFFQSVQKVGFYQKIWPLKPYEFQQWVKNKLRDAGLQLDVQALQTLLDLTVGNLSAVLQAIEKLKIMALTPSENNTVKRAISMSDVQASIANNATYSIYDFANAALLGDSALVLRSWLVLQHEGVEPTLVLWALSQELRTLQNLFIQKNQGVALEALLEKQWATRRPLLKAALSRLQASELPVLWKQAQAIDALIKGAVTGGGDPWDPLLRLALLLAGANLQALFGPLTIMP